MTTNSPPETTTSKPSAPQVQPVQLYPEQAVFAGAPAPANEVKNTSEASAIFVAMRTASSRLPEEIQTLARARAKRCLVYTELNRVDTTRARCG